LFILFFSCVHDIFYLLRWHIMIYICWAMGINRFVAIGIYYTQLQLLIQKILARSSWPTAVFLQVLLWHFFSFSFIAWYDSFYTINCILINTILLRNTWLTDLLLVFFKGLKNILHFSSK